jgi:iron complex outermembrane recepter protein
MMAAHPYSPPPGARTGSGASSVPHRFARRGGYPGTFRRSMGMAGLLLAGGFALGGATELKAQETGAIVGVVQDGDSGAPLLAANVRIRELGRGDLSHADGRFSFTRVRPGDYTVLAERIGYASQERTVTVEAGRTTEVEFRLTPSAIAVAGIVVTGVGRERSAAETYQPTLVLSGEELNRRLSNSLAATLSGEAGISMQSFGPAPAQPVIRGMSGDRVLVLEDGQRPGDLSSTAPDHAVGIDPVTAERIEVVRGPAGLLYGSNALGGVINVIREEVPRSMPDALHGTATVQAESAISGVSGGGTLRFPVGTRFAVRTELSARSGGELRTPVGILESTESRGLTAGAGASWIPEWGNAGIAYRFYSLSHGLPGEFQGQAIPGAHEQGAEAETSRHAVRMELAHRTGLGPFSSVEAEGNVVRYLHDEIELADDGGRVLGARFDQVVAGATVTARHRHEAAGLRNEGAVGVYGQYRDLITSGSFPGSRSATESSLAVFAFEELGIDPFRVQAGLRYDHTWASPADRSDIVLGDRRIPVRARSFGDVSGSLALLWEVRSGLILGGSLARAFRTPSIRELYSDGPHLADFSYDVGNPELQSEIGLGADLFFRVSRPGVEMEFNLFRNALDGYIYHAPTGEPDPRFRRFPVFEARGEDAVFQGADGRLQWELVPGLVADLRAGYVRAHRTNGGDDPLPAIPPLNGGVEARWERDGLSFSLGWSGASSQDRVPAPIASPIDPAEVLIPERPTAGYGLVGAGAGYRWAHGGYLHSITLGVENLLDREWHNHLSRIKDVAPESGRNVQLGYRVTF